MSSSLGTVRCHKIFRAAQSASATEQLLRPRRLALLSGWERSWMQGWCPPHSRSAVSCVPFLCSQITFHRAENAHECLATSQTCNKLKTQVTSTKSQLLKHTWKRAIKNFEPLKQPLPKTACVELLQMPTQQPTFFFFFLRGEFISRSRHLGEREIST